MERVMLPLGVSPAVRDLVKAYGGEIEEEGGKVFALFDTIWRRQQFEKALAHLQEQRL